MKNNEFVFHLLANAHLDPVWLWDWREGLNEGLITCRTILDLMEEDPELTFNRGEASIYQHIEETDPALFQRIADFVQAGRWDVVGGTYVQSDENLPATETLLRQYVRGQEYFRSRFGKTIEVGWAADCFGHPAGLPEILAAAGIRYSAFTRPFPSRLPIAKPAFWWAGAAGSRVLAYRPGCGWYGADRQEMTARLDQTLAQAPSYGLRNLGVFYGLGNHGGGPTRRQLADIRAWAAAHPEVRVVHSTMHRFFHALEEEAQTAGADYLPVHKGELNFSERGCYSALARLKHPYRRTDAQLRRAETTASVIAVRLDQPAPDLSDAWDTVLFNSFHDILPGSSIERASDEQIAHLGGAFHAAQAAEFRAMNALAARVDTRVASPDRPDMPTGVPFLVWNPHPQPFDGYVELEACLDWRPISQYRFRIQELPVRILDGRGNPLPFQLVEEENQAMHDVPWRKRAVVPVTLPPAGWTVMEMAWVEGAAAPVGPAAPLKPAVYVGPAIDNGLLRIDTHCGARGIRILRNGQPLLGGTGLSAAVFDDPWGSWGGPETDPTATDLSCLKESWKVADVRVLEKGPWRASLWVRLTGARSRIDLTLRLYAGLDEIEVLARAYWNEPLARLKLLFPAADLAEFEVPGGRVRRTPCGEVPGNGWVRLHGPQGPVLGFASDALHNFDCKDGVFRATVVRSSRYAYGEKVLEDRPWLPACDCGEYKFRFLLTGGQGNLAHQSVVLEQPPVTLPVPATEGDFPREGSILRIAPEGLRLLAFKQACDGEGWILRLQNTTDEALRPALTLLGRNLPLAEVPAGRIATWRIAVSGENLEVFPCDALERRLAS
ncbi:MAG TPA: glycoside hydrolase family 38 [Phycisphaerae bacterium]|nr:glycoside hydrolase family 38 [Phycisphaerae bacterium]